MRQNDAIRQFSRRARALDRRLTPRWARPQPRPVDRLLVRLSRAADSAIVNGPLKLAVGRRRPAPRLRLRHRPRTSSFPWGHPSDVVAGAAFGAIMGLAARPALRRLDAARRGASRSGASGLPTEAVLVVSPHAGNSRGLGRARRTLEERGIVIAEELDIQAIDRLTELLRSPAGEPRMVIAAGGDGTVGSVAGRLVGAHNILGVLPLGTGNDFARSLDIPLDPRRAAEQLAVGEVSSVDLGRVTRDGQPPAYFVHAASVGTNVDFAKLATRASVRARLGRLTYLAAIAYAIREQASFICTLEHEGVGEDLALRQLTVISAPVIGGSLGLNVRSPYRDDHGLDVLAIGNVPPWTLFRAGIFLLLGAKRPVAGVRTMHVDNLNVESRNPLSLALDGELDGSLPGRLETLPGALRVITPVSGSRPRE